MKKLIIVRHAKSSWTHNVIDHERPLNERGYNDAQRISNQIKNEKLNIDLVLSSDALRAKTTANIFIENLSIDKNLFRLEHSLYDFSGELLVETLRSVDQTINTLMIFGHNHAITHFVNTFGNIEIDNVPTCGVVVIEFDINNWQNLSKGKTVSTWFPRDFEQ